ncbi:MAG: hypothetical protein AAFU61_04370, partial [Pseudomonadota bacterium]
SLPRGATATFTSNEGTVAAVRRGWLDANEITDRVGMSPVDCVIGTAGMLSRAQYDALRAPAPADRPKDTPAASVGPARADRLADPSALPDCRDGEVIVKEVRDGVERPVCVRDAGEDRSLVLAPEAAKPEDLGGLVEGGPTEYSPPPVVEGPRRGGAIADVVPDPTLPVDAGRDGGSVRALMGDRAGPEPAEVPPRGEGLGTLVTGAPRLEDAEEAPLSLAELNEGARAARPAPRSPAPIAPAAPAAPVGDADDGETLGVCLAPDMAETTQAGLTKDDAVVRAGRRNAAVSAPVYEYLAVGSELYETEDLMDLSGTVGRLLRIREPAGLRELALETEDRRVRPVASAAFDTLAAPPDGPSKPVWRVLVVGDPHLVGVSGYARMERRLEFLPATFDLEVVFHAHDETGALAPARTFGSFAELEAAARAETTGPLGLSSEAFGAVAEAFAATIEDPAGGRLDRAILMHGSYRLGVEFPARFAALLERVRATDGEARNAERARRWLTVVSSSPTGFSSAYLRQPLADAGLGEFYQEPVDKLKPRRLLTEPESVAARMDSQAQVLASRKGWIVAGPATPPEDAVVAASDAFESTGLVLSRQMVEAMSASTQKMAVIASMAPERPAGAEAGEGPRETFLELLTLDEDVGTLPTLRGGPRWLTAAAADLTGGDYAAWVEGLKRANTVLAEAAEAADACSHVYFDDRLLLGLGVAEAAAEEAAEDRLE